MAFYTNSPLSVILSKSASEESLFCGRPAFLKTNEVSYQRSAQRLAADAQFDQSESPL